MLVQSQCIDAGAIMVTTAAATALPNEILAIVLANAGSDYAAWSRVCVQWYTVVHEQYYDSIDRFRWLLARLWPADTRNSVPTDIMPPITAICANPRALSAITRKMAKQNIKTILANADGAWRLINDRSPASHFAAISANPRLPTWFIQKHSARLKHSRVIKHNTQLTLKYIRAHLRAVTNPALYANIPWPQKLAVGLHKWSTAQVCATADLPLEYVTWLSGDFDRACWWLVARYNANLTDEFATAYERELDPTALVLNPRIWALSARKRVLAAVSGPANTAASAHTSADANATALRNAPWTVVSKLARDRACAQPHETNSAPMPAFTPAEYAALSHNPNLRADFIAAHAAALDLSALMSIV